MKVPRQFLVAGLLAILPVAAVFVVASTHPRRAPDVTIEWVGTLREKGTAVFTLSNTSPFGVVYPGSYRIQHRTTEGWLTWTQAFLPSGGMLSPGRSENIQVVVPVGQPEWRLEIDVARELPRPRGWLWIDQVRTELGRLGLRVFEPRIHRRSSEVVRERQ